MHTHRHPMQGLQCLATCFFQPPLMHPIARLSKSNTIFGPRPSGHLHCWCDLPTCEEAILGDHYQAQQDPTHSRWFISRLVEAIGGLQTTCGLVRKYLRVGEQFLKSNLGFEKPKQNLSRKCQKCLGFWKPKFKRLCCGRLCTVRVARQCWWAVLAVRRALHRVVYREEVWLSTKF